MNKKNLQGKALGLLIGLSLNTSAFAGLITADDYSVGQDVSHLTENVTLEFIKNEKDQPRHYLPSIINQAIPSDFSGGLNHDQYFGSSIGAATYETTNLVTGNPANPGQFAALSISFATPTNFFGFKAENQSGDLIIMALYDEAGTLIDWHYEAPSSRNRNPEGFLVNDFSYFYNFDVDVSSIILGGSSSATYIYALAFVPEPSALLLLSLGLAGLCAARCRKSETALA